MDNDIAVIGIGCRFPGADNIDEFWRVLVNGENHVVDIPPDRWNNDAFYSENMDDPGKYYMKKAGLLSRHDEWDNKLFGISDAEAVRIDPQQRYVLECTHMAMEDAGITRKQISGTNTGVYIGAMNDDYKSLSNLDHDDDTNYTATGMSTTIIASRVSYIYNLQGPCMVVDTACSSSITALHLGCEAIRLGNCSLAVCGGVNGILCPDVFITLSRAQILSPTGQCQTFCDTADGYARAEGCGVVILKSYKQAIQDKNKIWGIVRTGINQDGQAIQPITTPSGEQHEELFKKVYTQYDINPTTIQYIEAHGTGTRVGDRTEVNAIGRFISSYRNRSDHEDTGEVQPDRIQDSRGNHVTSNIQTDESDSDNSRGIELDASLKHGEQERILIGSVKSNIGHSESAAGMSGLIKVLLMMKNGLMVPSLHVLKDKSNLNKHIKLNEYGLDIAQEVAEWKPNDFGDRICCVNSFGFGGSNSHVIVMQRKDSSRCDNDKSEETCKNAYAMIAVSAVEKESLKSAMKSLIASLDTGCYNLHDIAFTSLYHRDQYSFRSLVFGTDLDEVRQQLSQKIETIATLETTQKIRPIFVFCGVGTTWPGMCREMMETYPPFRETMLTIDGYLKPLAGWSIVDKMNNGTDYIDPIVNHVAIFCTQVCLFHLWNSWGVYPEAIIGQSVGEVAAAYASGALQLEDAVSVIYNRSHVLSKITEGKMMVVGNIALEKIESLCKQYDNRVTIAVYNSSTSCTLSGESDVIDRLKEDLEEINPDNSQNIMIKQLTVPCAYHSHLVESSLDIIRSQLRNIKGRPRMIDHYSTVTGKLAKNDEFQTGQYWAANIRQPVRFMQAIQSAAQEGLTNVYVEIGPRQVLRAHIREILGDTRKAVCLPSMNANKECVSIYSSLSKLYELGASINWENVVSNNGKTVDVPRYVFNKTKALFIPTKKQHILNDVQKSTNAHMYIRASGAENQELHIQLGKETTPFVYDHYFFNTALIPGSTYIEAAFEVGQRQSNVSAYELNISTEFINRFTPQNDKQQLLDVEVTKDMEMNGHRYVVWNDGKPLCQGYISPRTNLEKAELHIDPIKARCKQQRNRDESYGCLETLDLRYGDTLSLIQESWTSSAECLTYINVPEKSKHQLKSTHLHPAIIDALFQTAGILHVATTPVEGPTLPKRLSSIVINNPPQSKMYGYAQMVKSALSGKHYNLLLLSKNGQVIAELQDLYFKTTQISDAPRLHMVHELKWNTFLQAEEMDSNETYNNTDDELMIFGSQHFIDAFRSSTDTHVGYNVLRDSSQQNERIFRNAILESSIDSKIVFAPFYHITNITGDSLSVYQRSRANFLNLKVLIQVLREAKRSVPLYVVTENVVASPDLNITASNVCGSELWGLVRSAVSETAYTDLRLVDMMFTKENLVALNTIIKEVGTQFHEYLVHRGRIYQSEFVEVPDQSETNQRCIRFDPAQDMILKSASPTTIENAHLQFITTPENLVDHPDYCNIRLHTICLHQAALYPISTVLEGAAKSIWPQCSEAGFPVVCLEGVGSIASRNHKKPAEIQDVGFCFPVDVSTTVAIPKKCMFNPASLPAYVPGMMTTGVILWNIADMCPTTAKICVIVPECTNSWINLIRNIFLGQQKEVTISQVDSITEDTTDETVVTQTVVMLANMTLDHMGILPFRFPNVHNLISIEACFPRDIERLLRHQYRSISIHILKTELLFTESKVAVLVPQLSTLIRSLTDDTIKSTKMITHEDEDDDRHVRGNVLYLPYPVLKIMTRKCDMNVIPLKVSRNEVFRKNGCYVLVGGLTGLGWELLQLIAELGAGYMATISRRPISVDKEQDISKIQLKYGCKIIPLQADITDIVQLQKVLKYLQTQICDAQIRGVLHGGGVTCDMLLETMTLEDIEKPMLPKILGTWNLHIATLDMPLDFFMMHSSIVSIFGNGGQCNYAAGNAFQDSFAHYRRNLGLSGQSINWSTLSVGMATANKKLETYLQNEGFHFLGTDDIRMCFIRAVMDDSEQIAFGMFDWKTLQEHPSFQINPAKFARVFKRVGKQSENTKKKINLDNYYDMTTEQQGCVIEELVKCTITDTCMIDIGTLSQDSRFITFGIDSMSATSFINSIVQVTQVRVSVDKLFSDVSTVGTLATYIMEQLHAKHMEMTKKPKT